MHSEPVPPAFQIYFYSALIIAAIVSLIAIVLYRRAVRRNMLAQDGTGPDLPTVPADAAVARALSNGRANEYAFAAQYLKARISFIYGGAILSVVLLSTWIRFFTGNRLLINGSTMFLMWRLAVGDFVALVSLAALLAAMGIPLLAVLLAWSWRRAAGTFLVSVGAWVATAFVLLILVYGWSIANAASILVVFQIGIIAFVAPQPFLLLLLTGHRRVRAVAPMTLAGSLLFCAVLLGGASLKPELFRLGTLSGVVGTAALFILSLSMCWGLLWLLAVLYERKAFSDRQLLVDCWSLLLILYVFARLGETPGTPQRLIALAFIVFVAYRVLIELALRLLVPRIERPPNRRLLLLRTFGFQRRTERLFDAVGERWRFHGAVLMIAGADLAAHIINPADFLRFLGRRLRQGFIASDADLQRNLERFDGRADPDGRYRVNELFCADHAWRKAVVALLSLADVVLMDLRGFGPGNQGCVFELQQLVERGPIGQIFLAVDDTTDRALLDSTIQDAWNRLPTDAHGCGVAANLNVVPITNSGSRAMEAILTSLQGANPAAVPNLSRRRNATFVGVTIAALLLISFLPMPWRRGRLEQFRAIASKATFTGAVYNTRTIMTAVNKNLDAFNHRDRGADLDLKGDYDAAIQEYEKALAIEPNLAEVRDKLGLDLAQKADYDAAIEEFKKALAGKPDFAEAHYNLGVALDRKDDDAAIEEFKKALAVKPNFAEAHYNLAIGLDRNEDYDAAIVEYRKALALNPDLANAHYHLGVDLDRKEDYDAAMEEFKNTLAITPDLADPHLYLGVYLNRRNDYDGAMKEFRRALAVKPNFAEAHYNLGVELDREKDYDAAIVEYRKALATRPGADGLRGANRSGVPSKSLSQGLNNLLANTHYNLGVDLVRKKNYDLAIEEFKQALAVKPNFAEAHYNLGFAEVLYNAGVSLDRKENYDGAIEEFKKALAVKPNYVEAHYSLGLGLDWKKDFDAAIVEYRKALAVKPNQADAHYHLAIDLDRKEDYDAAIEEFKKALALKPNLADAGYKLGLDLLRKADYEAAIEEFKKALVVKPDFADARTSLGFGFDRKEEYDAAIMEYRRALAINPDLADARYNLGIDLYRKEEYDAAIEEYRKALALNPNFAEAHYGLGVGLDRKEDHDAAIEEYRKALALNPNFAEAHYNLGVGLDRKKDYDAAIVEYRKALAIQPDQSDGHYHLGIDLDRKEDYDAAIEEFKKAVAIKPDQANAHYYLGVDLDRKESYDAAIEEFKKALAITPDLAVARAKLGIDLFRKGDKDAAVEQARKAVELEPNSAGNHAVLGLILYEKDDYQSAIAECHEAVAQAPDEAEAHYCLALALRAVGRNPEAEHELEEADRLARKRPHS